MKRDFFEYWKKTYCDSNSVQCDICNFSTKKHIVLNNYYLCSACSLRLSQNEFNKLIDKKFDCCKGCDKQTNKLINLNGLLLCYHCVTGN